MPLWRSLLRPKRVLVVGAGGAGLVAALAAAQAGARVTVACAYPLGQGCNTAVSGGGFMMATDRFSVSEHIHATQRAGRFLNDPDLVQVLCEQANEARRWLEDQLNTAFNPKHNGQGYWFTGGGAGFFQRLRALVQRTASIQVCDWLRVVKLVTCQGRCVGAWGMTPDGKQHPLPAQAVVLASGGYAGIFSRNDNPGDPAGEGIALALAAGASVRDMEFVQFYPLGLAEPALPTLMAFRPFPPQARVVDQAGRSLSETYLGSDDLNEALGTHRDRFSLAIASELERGPVFLDLTRVNWDELERWFSLQFLSRYDFPWRTHPARIAPIAHHTMGGIAIDTWGRTTVPGLYAVGEVASGVHGANRLGSNSLSECLVFGRRAGVHAAQCDAPPANADAFQRVVLSPADPQAFAALQAMCWERLGLNRNADGLQAALAQLESLADGQAGPRIAQVLARFALARSESRGAHFRSDCPDEDPQQATSLFARYADGKLAFVGNRS